MAQPRRRRPCSFRPTAITGGMARPGGMRHRKRHLWHSARATVIFGGMGAPGGRFHNRRSYPNRRSPDLRAARVMRTACAVIAAGMLLNPLTAHASPNPSPSLDRVLVVPQVSGYVEVDAGQGLLEGPFSAKDFAAASSELSAARIQAVLQSDGFVAGYGRTWIDQPNQRALAELVIAFKGGAGAKKWMRS